MTRGRTSPGFRFEADLTAYHCSHSVQVGAAYSIMSFHLVYTMRHAYHLVPALAVCVTFGSISSAQKIALTGARIIPIEGDEIENETLLIDGIDNRVGSLEVGKDGDAVLYDGDPFEYTTHCVGVVIEGQVVSRERR